MKREIKFRYWNSYSKTMIENVGFHPELDMNLGADPNLPYIHGGPMSRIIAPPFPDLVLMQFTGLKDKNGVDIYEGDIIGSSLEPNVTAVVEYTPGGFRYRWSDGKIHYPASNYYDVIDETVIGNIHQHPHLLTEPGNDPGKP